MTLFVGRNDVGKSNILRALNLFFNNETDQGERLDFDKDFYIYGSRERRADEISITIELNLPDNYKKTNGDFLVWEKSWRRGSLDAHYSHYTGKRIVSGKRGGASIEDVTIPPKSNLHATLKNIEFTYVPANKNADFFDALRGKIYHTISSVAQGSFHQSSKDFEKDIGKHLLKLTDDLAHSLGFKSQLSLPQDLSLIFEKLDFISPDNIQLNQRGDGIKARHIPHILHFMAQKQKELGKRGGPRHTTIWGYEEPENNLEMASCSDLAVEMFDYVGEEISQILITTHSPVLYNISGNYQEKSVIHHICKSEDKKQTVYKENTASLDYDMGVTAIYADKIKDLQKEIDTLKASANENKKLFDELANKNLCARIFVEGTSDKMLFEKALGVFYPSYIDRITFETKEFSAGHSYVIDMLHHWRSRHKHHPEDPRAAGILDDDAKKQKVEWNDSADNTKSAKCFLLPKPPSFINIINKNEFNVALSLEILYPEEIWKEAKKKNWLRARENTDYLKKDVMERIIKGDLSLSDLITPQTPLFVTHEVSPYKKGSIAKYICDEDHNFFKSNLSYLEKTLKEIIEYLFNE